MGGFPSSFYFDDRRLSSPKSAHGCHIVQMDWRSSIAAHPTVTYGSEPYRVAQQPPPQILSIISVPEQSSGPIFTSLLENTPTSDRIHPFAIELNS